MEKPRFLAALVLGVVVLAGCGSAAVDTGGTSTPNTDIPETEGTSGAAPTTTTAGGPTTSSDPGETVSTVSDRPVAPDFTLDLGTGGTYTLSEGDKPVYLIFWAEW